MKEIHWMDGMRETMERLTAGGIFLNVDGEMPNTMTIGWGWMGNCWNKPIFVVAVRPQRHTHALLERVGEFTISVPTLRPMKQELRFAGTQSGRDVNKFSNHGLTAAPAQCVSAPIVAECGLHYECKTLLTQAMTPNAMDAAMAASIYPTKDFHTMFFGEIVRCYRTDDD